ncbi:transthyretin-like family protein [Aeoliella mucimassa]|uniref:Carboxypeptidase regulatory-like domain-containing protein n=1 Tax=Aeoliella mucimassa TaxID=2527972 RepID=A0A518AUI0_9BACT|nr:hypothetical protein [Aeoliella mucimassa]QDU58377.1 hypothetical protein Pan181_46110 [Aeoliella mucimassa]
MQRLSTLIIGLGLLVLSGCSNNELRYAPVEGVLTVDNKPIAKAQIVLSCDSVEVEGAAPTSRGVTDQSGHFSLVSITPNKQVIDGAVVGEHRVTVITKLEDMNSQNQPVVVRKEMLGSEYTNGQKLTLSVPASGTTDVRFDLKSK